MRKSLLISLLIALVMLSCNKKDDDNVDAAQWPDLMNGLTFTQITNGTATNDYHCRWSNDGTQIAFARHNPSSGNLSLMVYNVTNSTLTEVLSGLYGDVAPSWSPDDTRIAFDMRETSNSNSQIYIVDLAGNLFTISQFSNTNGNCFRPAWSNDGSEIVFSTSGSMYKQAITSSSASLIPNSSEGSNPYWNSDDSRILYYVNGNSDDIFMIAPDGSERTVLADGNSDGRENWASFSPDGSQFVYQLYLNTQTNIIVKDIQSGEMTRITHQNDCRFPDWSPVSNTVVYAQNGNLWLVNF